jgi:hypothetical protein
MPNYRRGMDEKSQLSRQDSVPADAQLRAVADLLAVGFLRHRRRLVRELADRTRPVTENPLDDVAPGGRVPPAENRTAENGGKS